MQSRNDWKAGMAETTRNFFFFSFSGAQFWSGSGSGLPVDPFESGSNPNPKHFDGTRNSEMETKRNSAILSNEKFCGTTRKYAELIHFTTRRKFRFCRITKRHSREHPSSSTINRQTNIAHKLRNYCIAQFCSL